MSASAADLQFGQQLFTALLKSGVGPAGLVLSPLSVWFALVLVLNGAGPQSVTQRELWKAIGPPLPVSAAAAGAFNAQASALQARLQQQPGGPQLVIANAVWTKDLAVLPAFAAQMRTQFDAPVQAVSSVAPINAWAANVTNGLVKDVVPRGTQFGMIVANAVVFKGLWMYAFEKAATRKQSFTTGASKVVSVDMMARTFAPRQLRGTQPIRYAEVEGQWRGIRLPYKGSSGLAGVFILPEPGTDAYAAAAATGPEQVFDRSTWVNLFDVGDLRVAIPRFKVAVSQLSLVGALRSLGVAAAFDPAAADFSRISQQPLYITQVVQSAVVHVDEAGTEAAAVTGVTIQPTSVVIRKTNPPLVFDRPFLFFLVDDATQSVLFQGLVTDPTKTS